LIHFLFYKSGVFNLFGIASRVAFIMNYGRQLVQDVLIFCIAYALLPHAQPSLLLHVYFALFLLSIRIQ